jgi:predicted nicotinamide N-methyase
MQEPLYWVFCWASGQAMARYMMDNPQLIKGKRVLDFGCGSGVKHFNVPCYRKIAALDSVTIPDLDESAEFGHVNIYHASQKKKSSTSIDKFSGAQM